MARTGRPPTGGHLRSRLDRLRVWADDLHHRHVSARLRPVGPDRDRVERYLATGATAPARARRGRPTRPGRRSR